jgi:hypothetical protein
MAIHHPPSFINAYLQDKIMQSHEFAVPMFPTMPTDLSAATDGFTMSQLVGDGPTVKYYFNGAAAIYDRMFKMRRLPFPHIKSEQLLYYFFSLTTEAVSKLIEVTQEIQDLLDRGDESAEEVNAWVRKYQELYPGTPEPVLDAFGNQIFDPTYNSDGSPILDEDGNPVLALRTVPTARIMGKDVLLPYFHHIKVYQLQETRDIINFATARTFAGNKMIIDYDWHK